MHPFSPPGPVPPAKPVLIPSPAANQQHNGDLQAILVHSVHTILQTRYHGVLTTSNVLLAVLDAVVECVATHCRSMEQPPLADEVYTGGVRVDDHPNIPVAIWDAYNFYRSVGGRDPIDLRHRHAMEYLTNLVKRRGMGGVGGGTLIGLSSKNIGIAPVPGLEKEVLLADHVAALVDFVYNVLRLKLATTEEIRAFVHTDVAEGATLYLLTQEHVAELIREGQHRAPDLMDDDVRAAMQVCREVRQVMTAIFDVAEAHVRQSGGTVLTISSVAATESTMR